MKQQILIVLLVLGLLFSALSETEAAVFNFARGRRRRHYLRSPAHQTQYQSARVKRDNEETERDLNLPGTRSIQD